MKNVSNHFDMNVTIHTTICGVPTHNYKKKTQIAHILLEKNIKRKKSPLLAVPIHILIILINLIDNYYAYMKLIFTFSAILKSSDFDFLLTKGESKHQNNTRCSLLLRFDPLCSNVTSNTNRQSIISSNNNQPKSFPNLIDSSSSLSLANIHHTDTSSSERHILSKSTGENEFISDTLPIPELEQNSGANSSAEDNNNITIAVTAPTIKHLKPQPLISLDSPISDTHKIEPEISQQSTAAINLATNATFIHSAVCSFFWIINV